MNNATLTTEQEKEWQELQAMVDSFAYEMKARLYQKLQEGYVGWNRPYELEGLRAKVRNELRQLGSFNRPVEMRKCVDIANRLAMVWNIESALNDEGA